MPAHRRAWHFKKLDFSGALSENPVRGRFVIRDFPIRRRRKRAEAGPAGRNCPHRLSAAAAK
jgi:hypothetical protein